MAEAFDFEIEESKDGYRILRINKDNKKIYIGSKYRMKDKIDEFISNDHESREDNIFTVFGIGSGECIKELYKKYNKSKIIIYEPNLKLIEYIKENSEEYSFLEDEKVYLIDIKKCSIYDALKSIISEYDINKVQYKCLLNYDKVYDKEVLKFNKTIRNFISDKVINRNTSMVYSETWFKTLMSNLKYLINSQPVDIYKNKYKNIPAIIISAGPSLSKNIDELNNVNKDMMILSGGRTLRTLIEKDIEPDLIGVVDPAEASYKLVKGYIDKSKVPLLFYEGTNEQVVSNHNEKKLIFTQSNIINNIFDMNVSNFSLGGSIAHTLTCAAILFGCNPIIFIGQDLAYTGEKYHADIAIDQFSQIKDNVVKEKSSELYVEDINGDRVRTSESLDVFRRELEEIIKNNKDTTFINATEGGAKIKGTIQMSLNEAIKKYRNEEPINCFGENKINLDKSMLKENIIGTLKESIDADKYIKKKCQSALRLIDDLRIYLITKENSKINRILKDLDEIDKEIKNKYESLEILNSLIYPVVYSILSDTIRKKDNEIIEKNKFLYKSILDRAEMALEPIENVLEEIEKMDV